MSSDTDMLTNSSPYLIYDFDESDHSKVYIRILKTVLEQLELSMPQFVDLCILCGCDYNRDDKGICIKGIGVKKAYSLITKYKRIEDLPEKLGNIVLDKSILNYEICRNEFVKKSVGDLVDNFDIKILEIDTDFREKEGKNILKSIGFERYLSMLE